MENVASYYGWREWPFQIVADIEHALVWADRAALKTEIEKRLRRLRDIPQSTVQLMWADLGAGKTHTLRYIEARSKESDDLKAFAIYTEVPSGIRSFHDLYREFIGGLGEETLAVIARSRASLPGGASSQVSRDLRQSLQLLSAGDSTAVSLVIEWLQAQPGRPHLNVLKQYGIGARLESDKDLIFVASSLVQLMHKQHGKSTIWLIDEFQRKSDIPARNQDDFGNALVSLFNSSPRGLHLVISSSAALQATARSVVPAALSARAVTFPMLALPHLTTEECAVFLQELFAAVRLRSASLATFPLSEESFRLLLNWVDGSTRSNATPRTLMALTGRFLYERFEVAGPGAALPIQADEARELIEALGQAGG